MEQNILRSIKLVAENRLKPVVVEIEKRMIKRYIEAIGDERPKESSEMTAPPLLFCTPMMISMPVVPELPGYFERGLFGSWSISFLQDVRPGDVITATTKVADVREREGKLGDMVLIDYETEHYNQEGKVVALSKGTIIHY